MRFPELLGKVEQLQSDFAYVLDVLIASHAISEPDADVFKEIRDEHAGNTETTPTRRDDAFHPESETD